LQLSSNVIENSQYNILVPGGIYHLAYWNKVGQPAFDGNFVRLSEALEICGAPAMLLHTSDESSEFSPYRGWPLVLRQYWNPNLHQTNGGVKGCVVTLPLGYFSDWYPKFGRRSQNDGPLAPIETRSYNWSFVGTWKSTAADMALAMSRIPGGFLGSAKPRFETRAIMENSRICPIRMGNVLPDTGRFYESLEAGCIPLLEDSAPSAEHSNYNEGYYQTWEPEFLPFARGLSWKEGPRFHDAIFAVDGPLDWPRAASAAAATLESETGIASLQKAQHNTVSSWADIKKGVEGYSSMRYCELMLAQTGATPEAPR
jgi:hypothetical protein